MRPDESPDMLQPDAGVVRLNRRPLAIVVIILGAVVFALIYGILAKNRQVNARPARATERRAIRPAKATIAALAKDVPKTGPIPEKALPASRFKGGPEGGLIAAAAETAFSAPVRDPDREADAEHRRRLTERRRQMLETALTAVTRVATVEDLSSRARVGERKEVGFPAVSGAEAAAAAPWRAGLSGLAGGEDVNKQADKIKFAEQKPGIGYLLATRQPALSAYELKAGTVIPAVLISGVNSDLPGTIVAQVTQNVFDSATGNHVLVPQGSRLVGLYDSRISVGQSRVQVAWSRLNFPDSSTLELGGMPGTDQAGFSGFKDEVNNHVFRIFRDSLMLSLISAGAQLSQPRRRAAEGQPSAEEQIAAAMGQQFGAAGMELAKRNAQIQPTIQIRPGYRFVVMVNRDVVLRPYRPESQPE